MLKKSHGFTIVELLIVVVVIAILAAIVLVAYNGVTRQARISALSTELRKVDKSFNLWATQNGFNRWPGEPVGGGGVPLSNYINSSTPPWDSFKNYMQTPPSVQGVGTQQWIYDNDDENCMVNGICNTGDDKADCTPTNSGKLMGVNVMVRWLGQGDESIARAVNDKFDPNESDADWAHCGKIRWYYESTDGGQIIMTISNTKQITP